MKKYVVTSILVVSVLGAGLFATSQTFAQSDSQQNLVQMLADKFHLNTSDVQAVFDTHKQQRMVVMQSKLEDKLTQDVKDGKITEAQKTLILNKVKELAVTRQAEMSKLKSMTPAERRAEMEKHKQDLDAWAKQNGIDIQNLFPHMGMRKGHRMGF